MDMGQCKSIGNMYDLENDMTPCEEDGGLSSCNQAIRTSSMRRYSLPVNVFTGPGLARRQTLVASFRDTPNDNFQVNSVGRQADWRRLSMPMLIAPRVFDRTMPIDAQDQRGVASTKLGNRNSGAMSDITTSDDQDYDSEKLSSQETWSSNNSLLSDVVLPASHCAFQFSSSPRLESPSPSKVSRNQRSNRGAFSQSVDMSPLLLPKSFAFHMLDKESRCD